MPGTHDASARTVAKTPITATNSANRYKHNASESFNSYVMEKIALIHASSQPGTGSRGGTKSKDLYWLGDDSDMNFKET